jgi:hypothetical protein
MPLDASVCSTTAPNLTFSEALGFWQNLGFISFTVPCARSLSSRKQLVNRLLRNFQDDHEMRQHGIMVMYDAL